MQTFATQRTHACTGRRGARVITWILTWVAIAVAGMDVFAMMAVVVAFVRALMMPPPVGAVAVRVATVITVTETIAVAGRIVVRVVLSIVVMASVPVPPGMGLIVIVVAVHYRVLVVVASIYAKVCAGVSARPCLCTT